jgi:PTH1 family peptidyl-tRNA hydrolase
MNYIVGLGNPDAQYEGTRHNVGRESVLAFAKKNNFTEFVFDKKINALISEGILEYIPEGKKTKKKEEVILILPETYMNKSGLSLKKIISNAKKAELLTVVYDDLDLGLGTVKMNFDKGSGGHKGVESVIKSLKTTKFNRIRIGISPIVGKGKIKKPSGEEKVVKHVLGKFSPTEQPTIKKVLKTVIEGLGNVVTIGRLKTMNSFNQN